jgi:protein-disulfide isomerase
VDAKIELLPDGSAAQHDVVIAPAGESCHIAAILAAGLRPPPVPEGNLRKLWIVAGVVVVLAVGAAAAYRFYGPEATQPATATTEPAASTQQPAPATPATAAAQPQIRPDDRILGNAEAPVTVIEYASLTCPHCADFHINTLPQLKSNYIDKGTVRLVFRDFPLDRVALKASMLARCVPEDRYFAMLDVLFRSQGEWSRAEDPVAALAQIGRTAGLDQATVERCLNDKATEEKIIAEIQAAQSEFQIESTPTLIINGTKHAGALSFEEMDKILKNLAPNNS